MSWIENIQQKPRDQKMKLIWIITGAVGIVLVLLWIVLGKYQSNSVKKDTSLFKTIDQGIKNFKIQTPAELTKPNK
ncbi:MAG: hypothetical protein NVSMB66_3150 [Candidatus Doudnabacteria bacterium]